MRIEIATIVIRRDHKFLVVTNRKHEGYTLPGGRIEPGEAPMNAAKRELLEETGCRSVQTGRIGIFDLPWKGTPYTIHSFLGDIEHQEPKAMEEGTRVFWATRRDLLDLEGDSLAPVYSAWFMGKMGIDQ